MPPSRLLNSSPLEDGLLRRRAALLNRCALGALLLLLAAVLAAALRRTADAGLHLTLFETLALALGAALVSLAVLLSRLGRLRTGGWLVVGLALALAGAPLALLPAHAPALLPLLVLPVALAALLLGRPGIYLAALLAAAVAAGALLGPPLLPAPPLPQLPGGLTLALGMLGATLLLLSLILTSLSGLGAWLLRRSLVLQAERDAAQAAARAAEEAQARAQAAAARRMEALAIIADASADGLIAVDGAGVVARANPTARALWAEAAPGELVGQPFESARAAIEGRGPASQVAEVASLPAAGADGDGYTHILRDRRERLHYARLRGELLGLLAEEMRNPLTSMLTALDLTLGQSNLPDDVDRVLIGARRSGQRLLDLVTILLELDQLEQNPAALRRTRTSLRRLLDAGIAQMTPVAQQNAITVAVEYGSDGQVEVDSERTQRAFTFLLEHALRHSPPYSTVQVRTERQNGSVIVRISDQGPGMSSAEREALFDRRPGAPERPGPALGLAFSRLVIERQGGRIWPESGSGQGSTVAFSLPASG